MTNLENFFNKILNDNRIYTREDIGSMSRKEFSENEKAIDYQLANLGVPTNADVSSSNDVIFVHSYMREDGTKVKAHYRSKNGHNSGQDTGYASDINENVKTLQGGIKYDDFKTYSPWNSPLSSLGQPDDVSMKKTLIGFNEMLNKGYIDSKTLMNISINGTKSIKENNYFKVIDSQFNQKLSTDLGVKIPKNQNGIIFSDNSSLANNIVNSQEFLNLIKSQKRYNFRNKTFPISFNKDMNLFLGLHNATAINPHIDKDGYFNVLVYDNYDFDKSKYSSGVSILNNSAYGLQQSGNLEKYYFIVPLRFKLPF